MKKSVAVREKLSHKRFTPILRWVGWGIIYVAAFYLGNISGEYIAAQMPILPAIPHFTVNLSLPRIRFPSMSFTWRGLGKIIPIPTPAPEPVHTKTVIIGGNIINVPTDGATATEQSDFSQEVSGLAVAANAVQIIGVCDLDKAFISIASGATLRLTNTLGEKHSLLFGTNSAVPVDAYGTATTTIPDPKGIYSISCDGVIAGFYMVQQ